MPLSNKHSIKPSHIPLCLNTSCYYGTDYSARYIRLAVTVSSCAKSAQKGQHFRTSHVYGTRVSVAPLRQEVRELVSGKWQEWPNPEEATRVQIKTIWDFTRNRTRGDISLPRRAGIDTTDVFFFTDFRDHFRSEVPWMTNSFSRLRFINCNLKQFRINVNFLQTSFLFSFQ